MNFIFEFHTLLSTGFLSINIMMYTYVTRAYFALLVKKTMKLIYFKHEDVSISYIGASPILMDTCPQSIKIYV